MTVYRYWEFHLKSLFQLTGTVPVLLAIACLVRYAQAVDTSAPETPNVVVQWDNAALQGVRDSKMGPPMVARALAIVHTCIYDAWAAYSEHARGSQFGGKLRQPHLVRTLANKKEAISFAAYRAVADLFPIDDATLYRPLMTSLGYDPEDTMADTTTPAGVSNTACAAVLQFRHADGSNQLGDLSSSGVPYSDYTSYEPVNLPSTVPVIPETIIDPNRWQPLQYPDLTGNFVAEYWKDGPNSETPPGHWALFAQFVSARDHHTLDQDVKMFFAMTNATFDASIVAWDAKRAFDSVRPATEICYLFHGHRSDRGEALGKAPS